MIKIVTEETNFLIKYLCSLRSLFTVIILAAKQRGRDYSTTNLNLLISQENERCCFTVKLMFFKHSQTTVGQSILYTCTFMLRSKWPYLGVPLKVHWAHIELRIGVHALQRHILSFQNRLRWSFYHQISWGS